MRRRAAAVDAAVIPDELYYGIPKGAFRYFGPDDPRSGEEVGRHRRWTSDVRAAGFTVAGIRQAAETDDGYQKWLAWQARRTRVTEQNAPRK